MAGIDSNNVFTGGPNQTKVVGAVLRAPLGTPLPEAIEDVLDAAFTSSGYVTEDGLELTPDLSTTDIKDWSGAVVRRLIETFTNTLKWAHLETNEETLSTYLGAANVEVVAAATAEHGLQLKGRLNKDELEHTSLVFRIKDGPRRMLIVVPDGQVSKRDSLKFVATDATKWGVELTTFEDENGDHVLIYTDNGQKVTV